VKTPDPEGKEMSVTVDRGWIAEALRYVLYSEESARYLPQMIDRAAGGDFGPIVRAGLQSRAGLAQGLTQGMLMSVVCAEDIPRIRPEDVKKASEGTFLGDYRVRQQVEACRVWPRAPMPPGYAEDVRSDRPVLLLSGEFDPATSPQGAESAIRGLSNARHLVIPDSGHGWGLNSTECVDRIVGDFLNAAGASKLDTSCLAKVRRSPFETGGPDKG
jgi:pimeloyl-ACP methyl ester carboxylesterase